MLRPNFSRAANLSRRRKSSPKPRLASQISVSSSDRDMLAEMDRDTSKLFWTKGKLKRGKIAFIFSLILHLLISSYIVNQIIRARDMTKPFEELIAVEFVPPPPVKMKIRKRQIPKEIPKVVQTQKKAPSALTTRVSRRSPQQISEVIVKGPEIVRESVEIHRNAPISQILPAVTTAAQFEAKAETRHTISPPIATPTMIAAPGNGIVANRVRVAGISDTQGLSNVNSFGTHLRGGSGSGGGLGDGFEDVGTTPPKVIQIDRTADKQANDLFGIGEYVEETRGEDTQEVVYVLDASSSMSGTKIRLAIQALKDALSMLYPGDSFNIVTFDKKVRIYKKSMLPVNRQNLNDVYRFLDRLRNGSGTNLWGGLERALAFEASTVVLISDGDPSRGVTDPDKIVKLARKHNTSGARIMPIALGHGHSDDGVHLLNRLADEHGGQLLLIDLR